MKGANIETYIKRYRKITHHGPETKQIWMSDFLIDSPEISPEIRTLVMECFRLNTRTLEEKQKG